jgi:hypothetical protein
VAVRLREGARRGVESNEETHMTDHGQGGTSESGADLQRAASDVADQAARTTEAQASRTMSQAGQTLGQVAQAIRDAGNGMRDQQPQIASVADMAADRVQQASQYLTQHDAQDVVAASQDFARRQPMVVVGGGLLLGLALGRFLKTGTDGSGRSSSQSDRTSYGRSRFASTAYDTRYDTRYGGGYDAAGSATGAGAYAGTAGTGYASAGSVGTNAVGHGGPRAGRGDVGAYSGAEGYGSEATWDEATGTLTGGETDDERTAGMDVAAMSSETADELRRTDEAAGRES